MSLIRWNPARELASFPSDILNMQREINRMFDGFFREGLRDEDGMVASAWTPVVDIAEKEDSYNVKMELPGVSKDDVKITVNGNTLTVSGEKKHEQESKEANYHRIERSYGAFQRSFTLPTGVRSDAIDATFKDGVLLIALPKSEEAKPKQIAVKVK